MTFQDIQFVRSKDYKLIKEIDRGGFGKTVLLRDETIDEDFVCKKYDPYVATAKEEFYKNFVNEIKILHLLNDQNIVRVYNYYLYPEFHTGYILMEHIKGSDIEEFISNNPEKINSCFSQAIKGFAHLENLKILHRDIRPLNILVTEEGVVKIIDFGFGKQIAFENENFNNSISLNWRYPRPSEFSNHIYDFKTEVYFVGKLFEELIQKNVIENFTYTAILRDMIEFDYSRRINSFFDIQRSLLNKTSETVKFEESEKKKYQAFANELLEVLSELQPDCQYIADTQIITRRLEEAYLKSMLEDMLQNNALVTNSFLSGSYTYYKKKVIQVTVLKDFVDLLKSVSIEKRKIIVNNIWQRLDTVTRAEPKLEDDLPF